MKSRKMAVYVFQQPTTAHVQNSLHHSSGMSCTDIIPGDNMKTRLGFVSNSSSSSFCILAVQDEELAYEIISEMAGGEKVDFPYGEFSRGGYVKAYGYWGAFEHGDHTVGVDLKHVLKDDLTLFQAKQRACAIIEEETGITVRPNQLDIKFGEAGDG
jgi:hypothetical protein